VRWFFFVLQDDNSVSGIDEMLKRAVLRDMMGGSGSDDDEESQDRTKKSQPAQAPPVSHLRFARICPESSFDSYIVAFSLAKYFAFITKSIISSEHKQRNKTKFNFDTSVVSWLISRSIFDFHIIAHTFPPSHSQLFTLLLSPHPYFHLLVGYNRHHAWPYLPAPLAFWRASPKFSAPMGCALPSSANTFGSRCTESGVPGSGRDIYLPGNTCPNTLPLRKGHLAQALRECLH